MTLDDNNYIIQHITQYLEVQDFEVDLQVSPLIPQGKKLFDYKSYSIILYRESNNIHKNPYLLLITKLMLLISNKL